MSKKSKKRTFFYKYFKKPLIVLTKKIKTTFNKCLQDPLSFFIFIFTRLAFGLTILIFISIAGYIIFNGISNLSFSLFEPEYNTTNLSLLPALINTLIMVVFSILIAGPLGIFTAIFLTEYTKSTNKMVCIIKMATETLAGIPSIIYGLFGMLFFAIALGWGFSILAGFSTLAIMILPLIIRTAQEAIKSVPDIYKEGSYGLGAGKLRTIFKIILPSATPGTLAGIILSTSRVVSESAVLIYTAGTVAQIPSSFFDSGRTLAVHMYALANEGIYINQSHATALVLLVLVVIINLISNFIAKLITRKMGE